MATPRSHFSLAVLNGKIHAIGGKGTNGLLLGSVDRYDPILGTWTTASVHLTYQCADAGVVSYADEIYAIGGRLPRGISHTIERYYLRPEGCFEWKTVIRIDEIDRFNLN